MANFGVSVDTSPMASKMESISDNVKETTGAVVLMKDAVLQAEQEATDFLCRNVSGGFYDLIVSQIAQKSALAQSETKAFAMELMQQARELKRLEERMSKDYAMITKRNVALFNSLNKEMENRIMALDKAVIDFVKKDMKKSDSRVRTQAASVPVNQSESLSVSQAIAAARIKMAAERLIDSMYRYIEMENRQRRNVAEVIGNRQAEEPETDCLALLYGVSAMGENRSEHFYTPACLTPQVEQKVYTAFRESLPLMEWSDCDAETRGMVRQEVTTRIQQEQLSDRVADTLLKLFDRNVWKQLKP